MKIVYFIDHLRPDGAQFVLRQLVEGLAARGHNQTVICLNDSWDDDLVKRLIEAGAHVRIVGKVPIISGYGLLSTFRLLHRERFDVAVTLLFVSDVIGRTLAHFARAPRIVTSIQTHDEFYHGWQRWLERRTMPWADVVLLNSSHIKDFAIHQEGAQANRLRVIFNSINVENYSSPMSRQALRAELGIPYGAWLLGSVGRLTHQKGFDVLLNALSGIPEAHAMIAGVGEDEPKLRQLSAQLGIGPRVHFTGYRRDIPQLLGALDLYVHPSRYEGMPIIVLEAMAAGCGIVATAVDGTRELIEDGVQGWLVMPDDSAALTNAIQAALCNPVERQRRGAAAHQRVVEKFSVESMIAAWEEVLLGRG